MVYQIITKVVFLATIYIQFITSLVHCHKHGAPNKSCKTLLPHHKHITYHETSAEIKTFIIDGNNIDIEIQSEKPFKGKYNLTSNIGDCCDLVLLGKEGVGVGCLRAIIPIEAKE